MAVVIQSSAQKAEWNNTLCDCCGQPGGCGTCCYVTLCGCCAAGDVAKAAGRDYCMTCCVIPYFLGCILPCWMASDRDALVKKYNINDTYSYTTACCMFMCGCGSCLLCQELNHIKATELKGGPPQQGTTVIMVPQQQVLAGQPVSYQGR